VPGCDSGIETPLPVSMIHRREPLQHNDSFPGPESSQDIEFQALSLVIDGPSTSRKRDQKGQHDHDLIMRVCFKMSSENATPYLNYSLAVSLAHPSFFRYL
jgi:hypothetical protein